MAAEVVDAEVVDAEAVDAEVTQGSEDRRADERVDALLDAEPVDLDEAVVGQKLNGDKKEAEGDRGDLPDLFKRVARGKPGEHAEGELAEHRGERFDVGEL